MSGFSPAQAMIAAMITPALLILASGSLMAITLARIARIVDRIRTIATSTASVDPAELTRQERRGLLAMRALISYVSAVVLFVVAGVSIAIDRASGDRLPWLPVGITMIGMLLIVAGSIMLLGEVRIGIEQLRAELNGVRARN